MRPSKDKTIKKILESIKIMSPFLVGPLLRAPKWKSQKGGLGFGEDLAGDFFR